MEPKKLWIGADWQAERDHYGLDNRCGMFSTERFYEDDKGYVPADLMRELVEKAEAYCYDPYRCTRDDKRDVLIKALAAYKGEK